jgi:DNA-binding transcriptional regulator GbsR (MarR family)
MPQPAVPAIAPVVRDLTKFEHEVIDVFVRLADMLSIPKSVGEIYGLLFASAQPLSFQDIVERLTISKGSASQGLRVLRATGAAKAVYVAGDRRDHFVPETELRELLAGFLREKLQFHLESSAVRIGALRDCARQSRFRIGDPAESRILRARVDKLNSWNRKAKAIVPLIAKFFG